MEKKIMDLNWKWDHTTKSFKTLVLLFSCIVLILIGVLISYKLTIALILLLVVPRWYYILYYYRKK